MVQTLCRSLSLPNLHEESEVLSYPGQCVLDLSSILGSSGSHCPPVDGLLQLFLDFKHSAAAYFMDQLYASSYPSVNWTRTYCSQIPGNHNMNWHQLTMAGLCTKPCMCNSLSPVIWLTSLHRNSQHHNTTIQYTRWKCMNLTVGRHNPGYFGKKKSSFPRHSVTQKVDVLIFRTVDL